MLKNERLIGREPKETPPPADGFMGMVISDHASTSNDENGALITVFDVTIEKGDELLEKRVELRGRKLDAIDKRLKLGQEVYIKGYEKHEDRLPDRAGVNREYIDAVEIELPPVRESKG